MSEFKHFTGFGIPEENHVFHYQVKQENGEYFEIAKLRHDGTFIVMGREYKDIRKYVMEKEGIQDLETIQ